MKKSPNSEFSSGEAYRPCFASPAKADRIQKSAFTLLELIVVIVIIGIISGLSVPYFGNYFRSLKIKAACRELSAVVRFSQSEAVFSGISHMLNIDIDDDAYFLMKGFGGEEKNKEEEEEKGKSGRVRIGDSIIKRLPEGVKFLKVVTTDGTVMDSEVARIPFHPDGSTEGGIVWLESGRDRRLGVRIYQTGRAEVIIHD